MHIEKIRLKIRELAKFEVDKIESLIAKDWLLFINGQGY